MTTLNISRLSELGRPRPGDMLPPRYPTFAEQREERKQQDESTPGFFEGARHAINSEQMFPWLMRNMDQRDFEFDPDFHLTDDLLKELGEGLPDEMLNGFEDAVSLPHARRIREQLLDVAESRQLLAQMGFTGTALRMGANILDPAAIAIDLGASAIPGVNAAVYGNRLNRLQRLLRGGLLAASVEGGIEAILTTQDPERDATDIVYAATGAFILGGGANALLGSVEAPMRSMRKEIEAADARALGLDVTEEGEKYFTVGDTPVTMRTAQEIADDPTTAIQSAEAGASAAIQGKARRAVSSEATDEQVAVVTRSVTDDRADRTFGRQPIQRQLNEWDKQFPSQIDEEEAIRFADSDTGNTFRWEPDTNFGGPVPTEVYEALEGRLTRSQINRIVKGNVEGGMAEDFLRGVQDDMGVDGYEFFADMVEEMAGGDVGRSARALARARDGGDMFPEEAFLAHVYDITPQRATKSKQLVVNPNELPNGSTFTIHGEEHLIDVDEDGVRRIFSDNDDFILEAIERSPVDEGSLRIPEQPAPPTISDVDAQRSISLTDKLDIDGESGFPDAILPGAPKRVPDILHNGVDFDTSDLPIPPMEVGLVGRLRYSMTGRLMLSKSGEARRLARRLADDALAGTRPGDIKRLSASEWVQLEFKTRMARYYRAALHEFDQVVKAEGVPVHRRFERRRQFFEDVGRAVRRPAGTFTSNPHVNRVADLMRKEHAELLALAQRYQVKGFADIPTNATYLMRVHNRPAIDRLVTRYGRQQIEQLIAGAIASGSESLSEQAAAKIARGYLRVITKLGDDTEISKARMFSTDKSEELAQLLRENVDGITDAEVEDIIYALRPREQGDNTIPRAKRRLDLDETYRMRTEDGDVIAIEDILENNAETLMNVYTRQILGASATRQIQRDMSTGADDVIESWDAIANRLRRDGASDADLSRLETLYKGVAGHRLGDDTKTADTLRVLRSFQYIRVGNQFGFAQTPELANTFANAGFKPILQQMPTLARIFAKARDGRLQDELLREVEAMFGTGTDFLRHQALHRLDENDAMIDFGGGRTVTWDKAEQLLKRGQRFTSMMSGMAPVNTFLQRSTVVAGIQKWMNIAASGRKMSAKRLASMGLTEEMAERIAGQMRRHVTTENGLFGRRVRRLDLDKWDDLEAASNFMAAMDIWSRRVIQENDIGNLAQWMTTDLGKTFIQFRTFVSVAWEKQFLYNVRMRDWETFAQFTGTMVFGGLAYTAQQYANAIGREDREEYLAERLSTTEIAKAAWQRAGWSSILPPIADTALYAIGEDRQFSYARTSQLSGDALFGNPTADMMASLLNAPRSVIGPARSDYEFSQKDLRAMRNLLPFQNMLGIGNVFNALQANLPERSQDE